MRITERRQDEDGRVTRGIMVRELDPNRAETDVAGSMAG